MDTLKLLIVCWSFLWSFTVLALSTLGLQNSSIIAIKLYQAEKDFEILYIAPIYTFCIWIIGCFVLMFFHWLMGSGFGKFWNLIVRLISN